MRKVYDYIIVGAGSSGCVVAARLSEDTDVSVLLLEAGARQPFWDLRLQMPAAKGLPMRSPRYNWGYVSEPQTNLGGRVIPFARGRVLGGSSAINGMVFVRGSRHDYDGWAADPALSGWRYDAVLPYFKRLEHYAGGADFYRGEGGPVQVKTGAGWSPLYGAFVEAGTQLGYAFNPDFNGQRQDGFGFLDMTIHRGRRQHAADAYLSGAERRCNLDIVTQAQVQRLVFAGRRCVGVACVDRSGQHIVRAAREVVLAAGAIGSPHLLQLSGVGDPEWLRAAGVTTHHSLPGVGRNLHDHLLTFVQCACRKPITLRPATRWPRQLLVATRWLFTRSGWGATNHFEAGAFVPSRNGSGRADVQFHFLPLASPRPDRPNHVKVHGFQIHAGPQRPRSRGILRLRSGSFREPPLIDPRYLDDPGDADDMRRAIRLAREVIAQPAFDGFRGDELGPGAELVTDSDLDRYISAAAVTGFHPCGTCKMGTDADSVVDGALRVHGLEGLRVADSSVMPAITTGNINAPTIMIGEKAADLLRGVALCPLSDGDRQVCVLLESMA